MSEPTLDSAVGNLTGGGLEGGEPTDGDDPDDGDDDGSLDEDDEADDDEADDDEADDDEADGNRVPGAISRSVLDFVVRSIVDDPDAVEIDLIEARRGVELCVTVAPGDMGKVIGRRGHVVQALRTLVRAAGAQEGIEASVEIVD